MAICPECEETLDINEGSLLEGDTLECDDCGAELEVVSLEPVELIVVDAQGYDEEEAPVSGDDEN